MKKMKKRFLKRGGALLMILLFTKKRRKRFKKAPKVQVNVAETVKERSDKAARTVSKKMKRKLAASAVKLTRSVMRQIQAL